MELATAKKATNQQNNARKQSTLLKAWFPYDRNNRKDRSDHNTTIACDPCDQWFPNDRSDRKDPKTVDFAILSLRSLRLRSPPSKILGEGKEIR